MRISSAAGQLKDERSLERTVWKEGSLNVFTKGLTGNSTLAILRAIKGRLIKVMPRGVR